MTQASTDGPPISLVARVAQIRVVAHATAAPSPPSTAIIGTAHTNDRSAPPREHNAAWLLPI